MLLVETHFLLRGKSPVAVAVEGSRHGMLAQGCSPCLPSHKLVQAGTGTCLMMPHDGHNVPRTPQTRACKCRQQCSNCMMHRHRCVVCTASPVLQSLQGLHVGFKKLALEFEM
jgi:hypothetical protein